MSGELLPNHRRAVRFGSSQLGLRDASICCGGISGGGKGRVVGVLDEREREVRITRLEKGVCEENLSVCVYLGVGG